MDARFYNSEEIDIERLATDLENVYRAQNYQVQQIGNKDQMLVQLKKGGDLEALIGMQAALSVTLQHTGGGTLAMIGNQKWIDKAAVGAIGMLVFWPLAIPAGVGAIRQASLANQVLNIVDGLVRQQRPDVQMGPIPAQILPQIQQQWAPPSYSPTVPQYVPPVPQYVPSAQNAVAPQPAPPQTGLRCPNCNTPYEPGDTFCTGCGRPLAPQKPLCPNCKSELKPGVAFCPNCGASTFQSLTATQSAKPASAPKSSAPTYTPPAPKPSTPVYTPSQPASPKPASPPAPQPYVPPTPQEPPVMPQPSVTLIPGTAKPQPPAPPKQPHTPTYTPVYTPPQQSQQATPKPQTPQTPQTSASPPSPKPIAARPASQPAFDPKATWGNLVFSDGSTVQLSGERVLIGRYDHDLGGLNPEIDLSTMDGSDTVSRIHATIEHIGSSYTLTDLNSTNFTRLNGKRLEPDKATPLNDGDILQFGKVTATFKKV